MQPKPSEVRLTVALANSRAGRVDLMIPYGAKIQTLAITDALGRIVQKLAENQTVTSASSITWNGKDGYSQKAHTGVYFVRCVTNMGSQTSRLSVMQ
jgi:flagellar hook assembly protein FlgD